MLEPPPHPPERRFVARRAGGRSALVREDFVDAFDELGLLLAADLEPAVLVQEARARPRRADAFLLEGRAGRGAVAVLPAGEPGRVAVRPYRRGGLARRLSRDRYLLGRRAERELRVGERLRARGVPVVEAVAAVRSDLRWGYRAALVTRWAEATLPAGQALRDRSAADAAPILRALGRTAARLHAAGGWHADLHADNFLVPESAAAGSGEAGDGADGTEGEGTLPLLVDLDRGRVLPFPVPAVAGRWSLRRLARHLEKHGLTGALEAVDALRDAYRRERERLEP